MGVVRAMFFHLIENHPNCPLTYFRWVTLLFVQDPILSNDGVSSKPGAFIRLLLRKLWSTYVFVDTNG